MLLYTHADETGLAEVSIAWMAHMLGISEQATFDALEKLEGPSAKVELLAARGWRIRNFERYADVVARPAIPPALRLRVLERDGLVCHVCSNPVEATDVHIDHVIPLSRGGMTSLENLKVSHSFCNMSKGAKCHS